MSRCAYMKEKAQTPRPRVGIYNRCSTEEEAQKNALAIQAAESREIAAKKGWVIADQYIESESGTSVKNRTEYQRLMEDMERDIFDIVMIKSIDRLMRSAKDWYLFLSRLTENDKRLYIYIDDKFYTPDDGLISGIKAILAEEFSRELSKKIKNSHSRRQEMHRQGKAAGLNISRPMFGWDKAAKDVYVINEAEAAAYRAAFDMARSGKGFYMIANTMYDRGIRSKNGKRISNVQWQKMIYSPRAHGTMVIHTREYDFETHRFVKVPPEEWIYIENALPPIVTKEYQEAVLKEIEGRRICCRFGEYRRDMSNVGQYDLSRKIFCGMCGQIYYRTSFRSGKDGRKITEWKCSTAFTSGRKSKSPQGCDNINLLDEQLHKVIETACIEQYEHLFDAQQNIIDEAIQAVRKALQEGTADKELEQCRREYEKLSRRKDVLFDKLMNETIADDEFERYNHQLEEQMMPLADKIRSLEQKNDTYADYEERLAKIKESFNDGDIVRQAKTQELITKIEKIVVYSDGKIDIIFDRIKLLGMLKIYETDILPEEKEEDDRLFRITAQYVHTDIFRKRREEYNGKILEILQKEPLMTVREIAELLGVTYSYAYTSVKQLRKAGKLPADRRKKQNI